MMKGVIKSPTKLNNSLGKQMFQHITLLVKLAGSNAHMLIRLLVPWLIAVFTIWISHGGEGSVYVYVFQNSFFFLFNSVLR